MSTFIDLDSFWRNRENYPNENAYELTEQQTETWFRQSRSVRAFPQNPSTQPLLFVTTINIKYLTLPYTDELSRMPRIYVNFRSKRYADVHLIQAIDGKQSQAKFICVPDRIQTDNNDVPLWIHYRCTMEQTMRFENKDTIIFEITTRSGDILPQQDTSIPEPPDPLKQSLCTFELTPYIRDSDYDNHLTEPMSM